MATLPVGEDQSLKKAPPVTQRPVLPRPVRVELEPWGRRRMEIGGWDRRVEGLEEKAAT